MDRKFAAAACLAGLSLLTVAPDMSFFRPARSVTALAQPEPPPTLPLPTAAPPVATCVATPRAAGLYPDLVVWPPVITSAGSECADPLGAVLRVQVDNHGNAPATGFWIRAEGCTVVAVQARVPELLDGSRATVDLAPLGDPRTPCVILADAECELNDRYRADNYWSGLVVVPTPQPCVPTAEASPSATTTSTVMDEPTATPVVRFVPWSRQR